MLMTLCFVGGRKQRKPGMLALCGHHHLSVKFTHGIKCWDASDYQAYGTGNISHLVICSGQWGFPGGAAVRNHLPMQKILV